MLTLVKAAQTFIIGALLMLALGSMTFIVGSNVGWWKADVVLTGSMEPTMPVGSLVLAKEVPTTALRTGDVLMFNAPMDGNPRIMHRIVTLRPGDGDAIVAVRTKGDNNPSRDFWVAQISTPTSLVVDHHVPLIGYVVNKPMFMAFAMGGLVLLLFGLGTIQSALESPDESADITSGTTPPSETVASAPAVHKSPEPERNP